MAKFDFLPDLHHVYNKVAFFASYEQLQSQTFKKLDFSLHLAPLKGPNEAKSEFWPNQSPCTLNMVGQKFKFCLIWSL